MAFKSFVDLAHKPLLVDMTIEDGIRLKVVYGSYEGFHAIELDSSNVYDIYVPTHVRFVEFVLFSLIDCSIAESRPNHSTHHNHSAQFERDAAFAVLQ